MKINLGSPWVRFALEVKTNFYKGYDCLKSVLEEMYGEGCIGKNSNDVVEIVLPECEFRKD